jgi:hypothetical protein
VVGEGLALDTRRLRVLSVDDLGFGNKGGGLFMSYLQRKEQLAARGAAGALGQLGLTGIP